MKLLLNTMTNWDEPPRTRHQIAFALAKNHEVVFIESNTTNKPGFNYRKINDNLMVLQPGFPLDKRIRYRIPLLNEIYQLWLFRKLLTQYRGYDIINFDFSAYLIHNFFRGTIYYCNDNFTSISKKINNWFIYKYHAFCEKKMIRSAKFCIGTSRIITHNLLNYNDKSYEIALGGPDIDEYDIKPNPKTHHTGRLKIGLVGFIKSYNLSADLLNDILQQIDCEIILIGPLEQEFYDKLKDKSRVVHKGVLTGKELLDEVNQFDVAIAPYLERKIEEGGLPNKLLIYLALGKPIVLTELMSLKELNLPEKMIYPIKKSADFSAVILKAHSENEQALIDLRVIYARDNTWEKRVNHIVELICYT